jgi:transposase InsO family protein
MDTAGSPWERCYIKSYHDKLRDEFLNQESFFSLLEAEIRRENWRGDYNANSIHRSLNYRKPDKFGTCCKHPLFVPTLSYSEISRWHRPRLRHCDTHFSFEPFPPGI